MDDLEAVPAQRAPRVGHFHDRVDDARHLRLGGPVGEEDLDRDADLLEVTPGELHVLGRDPGVRLDLVRLADPGGLGHRHDDADPAPDVGLGVRELRHGGHGGLRLEHPVEARQAEVEEPVLDVTGDLLGPQQRELLDARVVDPPVVVAVAAAHEPDVGGLEEGQRLGLEASLGDDELQHDARWYRISDR